jgi:anti-anti-sigma regulatory factor
MIAFDLSSSPMVDLAGARMLEAIQSDLQKQGVILRLVGARASVRDSLRAEGLEERVGRIDRGLSLADVVEEFQGSPRME